MANKVKNEFKLKTEKKHKVDKSWINRHLNDAYVKKAASDGYRSRAAYKLIEMADTWHLFKNAKCVIDLGSAPGSWSQVARKRMGDQGTLISIDLLPMTLIPNVNFIQGDFTENVTLDAIMQQLDNKQLDLIISDMSPNISGIKLTDQARMAYLVELVLDFARDNLKTEGNLIMKVFEGGEFGKLLGLARRLFTQVKIEKPESSRKESSEFYMLCLSKKQMNSA